MASESTTITIDFSDATDVSETMNSSSETSSGSDLANDAPSETKQEINANETFAGNIYQVS